MTVDKEAIPNAELFLKKKISTYAWGTPFGLNKLPIVLYEEVAKVMDEYSSSLLKENEELKKDLTSYKESFENNKEQFMELAAHAKDLEIEIAELKEVLDNNNGILKSIVDDLPKGGLGLIFVKQQIASNDKYLLNTDKEVQGSVATDDK